MTVNNEEIYSGAAELRRYLDATNLSISAFCRENKLDVSEISKMLRGERQRISVDMAGKIESATQGFVTWRSWIRFRKQ